MKASVDRQRGLGSLQGQGNLVKPRLRLVHGELGGARNKSQAGSGSERRDDHQKESTSSRTRGDYIENPRELPKKSRSKSARNSIRSRNSRLQRAGRQEGIEKGRAVTLISAGALALVVFAVVTSQVMLAQAGYSKASAQKELDRARAEYERARLEEAEAQLPNRVEKKAREDMGFSDAPLEVPLAMGPPEADQAMRDEPPEADSGNDSEASPGSTGASSKAFSDSGGVSPKGAR